MVPATAEGGAEVFEIKYFEYKGVPLAIAAALQSRS